MRAKSFTPPLFKKDKNKIVVKEPKIRLSKELRQAAFGRKAGRMGKRKAEKLEEIIKKELNKT